MDHSDVTVDEIIYLASEFAGDAPEQYEVCYHEFRYIMNGPNTHSEFLICLTIGLLEWPYQDLEQSPRE